ncbi:MAG: PQQ-binding-like beta-propeller repeat protein [Vicinamibacterales bacterium]
MRIVIILLATAALAGAAPDGVRLLEAEGEAAKYWPRWRGPSGQGLVRAGTYPDAWSETQNVEWKVAVPGRGNSSPIVWGDRIFFTTAYDGGAKLSLLCYRRSDGKLLWELAAPQEGIEHVHQKNGHASATPVTDGQRVYASFGPHGVIAATLEGKLLWHARIGRIDNYHGTAGSPVLYKDTVIIYHDGGQQLRGPKLASDQLPSFIAAFDRATGKLRWRTPRTATVGWGTSVVIRAGARDELVVCGQRRAVAYDPANGQELWAVSGLTFEVIPTPVVGHDLVFCSSGRAGPTIAIRPGGSGDVTATHVAWSTPKGSPFVPSGVIVGDVLYLVNDMQSIVTAYEAKTGSLLFQGRLGVATREGFSSSPIAVGGKVFFTNDDGETFVLAAGREFKLLHVNQLGEPTYASPALVDGRWYFRTASSLLAIGHGRRHAVEASHEATARDAR